MSIYLGNQKVKPFIIGDDGIKYIWDENIDFSKPIDVAGYKKFSVNGGLIDDGHARIWVDMNDESNLAITVRFNDSSNQQVIDWGDDNIETFSAASQTRSHTYAQTGKYIIDISSNNNSNKNALGQLIVNQSSNTTIRNKVIYVEDNAMSSVTYGSQMRFEYLTSLKIVKFGSNFYFNNNIIPGYTCDGCTALENFDFHGATSIGDYAFRNCSSLALTSLPSGLTSLGNNVFRNCTSLAITSIPETVTTIGQQAFYDCTGLTQITIPAGITTINNAAFSGCSNLTSVTILATTPPTLTNSNAFPKFNTGFKIYVPAASLDIYKSATNWSDIASYMEAIPT